MYTLIPSPTARSFKGVSKTVNVRKYDCVYTIAVGSTYCQQDLLLVTNRNKSSPTVKEIRKHKLSFGGVVPKNLGYGCQSYLIKIGFLCY